MGKSVLKVLSLKVFFLILRSHTVLIQVRFQRVHTATNDPGSDIVFAQEKEEQEIDDADCWIENCCGRALYRIAQHDKHNGTDNQSDQQSRYRTRLCSRRTSFDQ